MSKKDIRKAAASLSPAERIAVVAAVDELASAISAKDGDGGGAAIRRIQALSPEVGNAVLDHLVDEATRKGGG
ncbi:hypothetical protein DMB42_52040 [Nonomuraea sp. WAC 01424]|uniref:hypothetical protein n=1 Tax=Nonomuraea sp. WAC 01424 TaxID=2203200 RepID=UPI000F77770D|nr:hypothetical protein [Nonomuraea sp. WAC 01424]RSM93765.1 hypothetical protein DMB42_52040 [Nonomuraea sp. WAC 01424]